MKDKLPADWILLAVDRHGEPLVLDGAEGLLARDLLPELFACDCGIVEPKQRLRAGLYKMTEVKLSADSYGDPVISGTWHALGDSDWIPL